MSEDAKEKEKEKERSIADVRREICSQMGALEAFYAANPPSPNYAARQIWYRRKDRIAGRLEALVAEYRRLCFNTFNPDFEASTR